jgi:hypothetical protein
MQRSISTQNRLGRLEAALARGPENINQIGIWRFTHKRYKLFI